MAYAKRIVYTDELKSVSENALSDHLSHGDVLASEVDNCELPPVAFCLELQYYEGLGYSEYSQYLDVYYYPSTVEVFDSSWPLQGGLLPIMLGSGKGSEFMRRIAAPMVGGIVSATILTLAVIPAVFLLWQEWKLKR
jgi:hypothetical protein